MNRPRTSLLVIMLYGALASANAAVAAPQEQEDGPRLLSAEIILDVEDPTAAVVTATFRLGSGGDVSVLLADLPGQRLEQLELRADGESVAFEEERRSSAMRAIRPLDAAGAELLEISYRVQNAESALYRFALPVPEAIPRGDERSVRLTVRLPDNARFAGNSFPPLIAASGTELTAATLAVPAMAHVVFGDAGLGLWAHQMMEWTALGVAAALCLGGWYWSRRRARKLAAVAP